MNRDPFENGQDRNGFASHTLSGARQPEPKPENLRMIDRMSRRRRMQNGQTLKERLYAIREWMHRRGSRRLMRDGVLVFGGIMMLYLGYLWITLPDISDPQSLTAAQSSVIVDRKGVELYRLYSDEDRTYIPGDQIPEHLKNAVVAIEDSRFYDRGCIDMRAMARVVFRFGQAGGASTLTRQLARNALDLTQENILNRKIKEIILGCQLESQYSKEDLLNLYLNWIPFGKNAYGIGLASKTYFNKEAKDLTLPESAILAALPQAPSYYNPYGKQVRTTVTPEVVQKIADGRITNSSQIRDEDFWIGLLGANVGTGSTTVYIGGRTDQVLKNMEDLGYITEKERTDAIASLLTMTFQQSREDIRAPHFVLWVKDQVQELLNSGSEDGILDQGGLQIETTLDWDMQQAAEKAVAAKAADIARVYMAHNIALVSVETGTNNILAYVGNTDYADEEFSGKVDMAQAPRQPGSSFKPFVYAQAFEKGYSPSTIIYDVPTKIGTDEPQNFDGQFWGLLNVRRALDGSRNIPAAKAFFMGGGEDSVLAFASRLGVTDPAEQKKIRTGSGGEPYEFGWPLALGAAETPLVQMVEGYATFANGGMQKPLNAISKIKDRRGNILYDASTQDVGVQGIDARIAYLITAVLSDTASRPNEFWQNILNVPGYQTAAKTGTSNKCMDRAESGGCTDRKPSDLWTIGYTPNIITGVWIGNADSKALSEKAESLSQAAPMWQDYMIRAHKLLENPKTSFPMPSGIVQAQISTLSGELPTECTPIANRQTDIFLQENAPSKEDSACVRLLVDKVTGLLASDECPAEATEMRSFLKPTSVLAQRFPEWDRAVQEWAKGKMAGYDPLTNTFSGSSLPLPLAPTEKCELRMTPGRMEKPEVELTFPQSGDSAPYPAFQPQFESSVGSSLRSVEFFIDDKSVGVLTDSPFKDPIRVPRSISESGTHTLKIVITDEYYNTASDEVSFRFGTTSGGPDIRLISPASETSIQSGESLSMSANADSPAGIKYVEFFLDGQLLTTKPNAPYNLSYTVTLPAGTYTLKAVATDYSNKKADDEVEVTVTE
ncbi:transglycosylase domain-containing protein [Candidatus Peribacteria bacterium]|nr:MAG: transglycosylase domain-containing protein [Candidatus Peribacteria bacterium]